MNIKSQKIFFTILNMLTAATDILAIVCETVVIASILSTRFGFEINPFLSRFIPEELTTMSYFNLAFLSVGSATVVAFSITIFTIQSLAEGNNEKMTYWPYVQRGIIITSIIIIAALYLLGL